MTDLLRLGLIIFLLNALPRTSINGRYLGVIKFIKIILAVGLAEMFGLILDVVIGASFNVESQPRLIGCVA